MEYLSWSCIPQHILVDIFIQLRPTDRFHASLVCRSWNDSFHVPFLWSKFTFRFLTEPHTSVIRAIEMFGQHMQNVSLVINQSELVNRENACSVLTKLAQVDERRLRQLSIWFVGENPVLYNGHEFLDALSALFGPVDCTQITVIKPLTHVDLSGLSVTIDGKLIELLAENNGQLELLNIQNKALICMVSPDNLLRVVRRCCKLRELHTFNCTLSDDVLSAFADDAHVPVEHLSIRYRREDKFSTDVSADIWKKLLTKNRQLKVTLGFDHTCPMHRVSEAMLPEIPVHVLRLETFSTVNSEIVQASNYYSKTLEKLVASCPSSRTTRALDDAVLQLSAGCPRLRSLHVFCLLEQTTVETVLDQHPDMKQRNSYTLKYVQEPHPWSAGHDC